MKIQRATGTGKSWELGFSILYFVVIINVVYNVATGLYIAWFTML